MSQFLAPELWGGLECTVNRVGDRYFDQVRRSGHHDRPEDLERFAALGLRTLRYPVLWERTAPDGLERADWSWPDARLRRLRELGVKPIVGFVHHGSGPRHTSLLESSFASGLAAFAGAVAERYPWVELYTPVNEPLTTARFGCLYGHWYPHARDALSFSKALLNECRATVLAMAAVRRANPEAKLVQTEDLGKIYSTPGLRYQADFENERRWLSLDLLCGRVDAHHPMWGFLRFVGVSEPELAWFLEHPCPPDVLGFNYYLTSERFLDERLEHYPLSSHGSNGRQRYADVEAVRVLGTGLSGPYGLLHEAWSRYGLPLAVSEAHLGCTREEQLRWLLEVWEAAQRLRTEGCDVRAVTVWSLLGAHDWNSLLTRDEGFYEPGVFDVRAPVPRPTALAETVRALAAGQRVSHPVLAEPGWWRRPERLLYPVYPASAQTRLPAGAPVQARPLLIVGTSSSFIEGTTRVCKTRGLPYRLISQEQLDGQPEPLHELQPWAVVHAGGAPNGFCTEPEPASAEFLTRLGDLCRASKLPLLAFSSSFVFDGRKAEPYLESDSTSPRSASGTALAEAELYLSSTSLIVRTGPLFSSWVDEETMGEALEYEDALVSPAYLPDVLHAALDLLVDGARGLWHLAPTDTILLSELNTLLGTGVTPRPTQARITGPPEQPNWTLRSERGGPLPPLGDALARYAHERKEQLARSVTP
ncbi:MAG: GH1 [uncultured Truepera sp.]|uniref:GH1 n=1 Tax=uncultured Truepera sp. TaxID=543023 RepID=A0A6J4ULQ3_9DEIN|nr:MAG: GH1 [uncultured Truepera sp.]